MFCQQCVVVWFNVTLRQQKAGLPEGLRDLPQMITYHCPSCRTEVTKIPLENYSIKAVIDAIGTPDLLPQMGNLTEGNQPLEELLNFLT